MEDSHRPTKLFELSTSTKRKIVIESRKPSHVRRLNFGQSILTSNMVTQFRGQEHGVSLTEENVTDIPCTERNDYVREWIETCNNSNQIFYSSPVLLFPSSDSARSPVLVNRRKKRPAEKCTKRTTCSNESQNIVNGEPFGFPVQNEKRTRMRVENERKENIKRNLFDSQPVGASYETTYATRSPVLCRDSCSYRRRRRKLGGTSSKRKALNRIENNCIQSGVEKSPLICSRVRQAKQFSGFGGQSYCYQQRQKNQTENDLAMDSYDGMTAKYFESKEQTCRVKRFESSVSSRDLNISEDPLGSNSSTYETRLNIDDNPKDVVKETAEMEIETSNEDDSEKGIARINTDTDRESSSDRIEDADTQDVASIGNKCNHDDEFSTHSRISNKDSDETFFSKVEQPRSAHTVIRFSQNISQTSTQVRNVAGNGPSQTGIIVSTETSPRKNNADESMRLTVLDSAKKRRKPKRGSLLEKLQSTINRQVSFVRVWSHRLKEKAKQTTSLPCVTISVRACITRFGKQFLEGIVVKDPFNLLSDKEDDDRVKFIRFVVIPDITGRIEMKSTSLVQIFPPWEILDRRKLMLCVTYIRVVTPDCETDVRRCTVDLSLSKRSVIRDFDCACTDTSKMIAVCKDRFNKPNVMEKLFA
ncbi:unnamed protein product [Xylocopa violacea]|uniref:Uncharacterized protein n=1 Tax=Xylocopa violacea TaxID=135666 RepID=A0ABP1N162_XYLVO